MRAAFPYSTPQRPGQPVDPGAPVSLEAGERVLELLGWTAEQAAPVLQSVLEGSELPLSVVTVEETRPSSREMGDPGQCRD